MFVSDMFELNFDNVQNHLRGRLGYDIFPNLNLFQLNGQLQTYFKHVAISMANFQIY